MPDGVPASPKIAEPDLVRFISAAYRAVGIATGDAHKAAELMAASDVRRAGVPRDIDSTIAFLCSDEAFFVSGQVIYLAGGPRG